MTRAVDHVHNIGVNDEWETPPGLLLSFLESVGISPELDVAANRYNRKFERYIDSYDDALALDWDADFFCNPPYSRVGEFLAHGAEQVRRHRVSGVFLVYAKTDTRWWHEHVEGRPNVTVHFIRGRVHFIRGRVRFLRRDTDPPVVCGPAPYPSCWIIMRPPGVVP